LLLAPPWLSLGSEAEASTVSRKADGWKIKRLAVTVQVATGALLLRRSLSRRSLLRGSLLRRSLLRGSLSRRSLLRWALVRTLVLRRSLLRGRSLRSLRSLIRRRALRSLVRRRALRALVRRRALRALETAGRGDYNW